MRTKYKHIYFEEKQGSKGNKNFYLCLSNKTDSLLGEVFYYYTWRKYVFGANNAIFDESCLADIQDFMKAL